MSKSPQKVMNAVRSTPAEKEDPSWIVVNQRNCFKVHLSTTVTNYMNGGDKTCLAIEKG